MGPEMSQETEHLKLLAIFHYIVGGVAIAFSFFPVFHLLFGLAMVAGYLEEPGSLIMGWVMVMFAVGLIVLGWLYALGMILAGRFLRRHRNYIYCLVMACLSLFFTPIGTVLGIFTLVVLAQASVREMFQQTS